MHDYQRIAEDIVSAIRADDEIAEDFVSVLSSLLELVHALEQADKRSGRRGMLDRAALVMRPKQ